MITIQWLRSDRPISRKHHESATTPTRHRGIAYASTTDAATVTYSPMTPAVTHGASLPRNAASWASGWMMYRQASGAYARLYDTASTRVDDRMKRSEL